MLLTESCPPGRNDEETVLTQAMRTFPQTAVLATQNDLMEVGADGTVIVTPSALHAEEAAAALERGVAVFCEKPELRAVGASTS